jgi:hypothetical protein
MMYWFPILEIVLLFTQMNIFITNMLNLYIGNNKNIELAKLGDQVAFTFC